MNALMRRFRSPLFLLGCGAPLVLFIGLCSVYTLRHQIWGKSVSFYMTTGLKMPLDATIVAETEDYPGQYSNEGESLLVFDIKPSQQEAFRIAPPWQNKQWVRGPIPENFMTSGGRLVSPYYDLWKSTRVWYVAHSRSQGYWDGELMVFDPAKNRVYLLEWNH